VTLGLECDFFFPCPSFEASGKRRVLVDALPIEPVGERDLDLERPLEERPYFVEDEDALRLLFEEDVATLGIVKIKAFVID
jgi:hypothetical protein